MKIKSIYFIVIIFFLLHLDASAQYRYNKHKYNASEYQPQYGDKYSPKGCGFASFCLPGLGQAIAGEPVRGLKFFGFSILTFGVSSAIYKVSTAQNPYVGPSSAIVAIIIFHIIDVSDAIKVAKVNNMADWDRKKTTGSLYMLPNLDWCNGNQKAFGIKVGYTF